MKVRTRFQRVCGLTAWVVVLPAFFVVCVIMLAGFLMSSFLDEHLHTEE